MVGETGVSPTPLFTGEPPSHSPEDQDEGDLPSGIDEDDLDSDEIDTTAVSSVGDSVPDSSRDDGRL